MDLILIFELSFLRRIIIERFGEKSSLFPLCGKENRIIFPSGGREPVEKTPPALYIMPEILRGKNV